MQQNKPKMKAMWETVNKGWYIALIALLAIALSACGKTEKAPDGSKVIAVYKGGVVSEQEFTKFVNVDKYFNELFHSYYEQIDPEAFREQLLRSYISFKILGGRADAETVSATEKDVSERMEEFRQELESDEEAKEYWEAKSAELGITLDDVKQYVLVQAGALNYVTSQVSDEKVKELYDQELKADPHAFTLATVRHVLVAFEPDEGEKRTNEKALAIAKEIKQILESGQDFAEVAQKYSDDGGSKNNGGKYESVPVSNWEEPFKEAAVTLPIGKISDPVETVYGYHIIKVEERKEQTFEELREELEQVLMDEIYMNFVNQELDGLIEKIDLPA